MPTNYEFVKFYTADNTTHRLGMFLSGCTNETGSYIPRSVVDLSVHTGNAKVYPFQSVTIVKEK